MGQLVHRVEQTRGVKKNSKLGSVLRLLVPQRARFDPTPVPQTSPSLQPALPSVLTVNMLLVRPVLDYFIGSTQPRVDPGVLIKKLFYPT